MLFHLFAHFIHHGTVNFAGALSKSNSKRLAIGFNKGQALNVRCTKITHELCSQPGLASICSKVARSYGSNTPISKLLEIINNFVALRLSRLGARDILELPLLATSSKMETALMAGQTWQPSHEPPRPAGGPPSQDGSERRAHGPWARAPKRSLPTAPNTTKLLGTTLTT